MVPPPYLKATYVVKETRSRSDLNDLDCTSEMTSGAAIAGEAELQGCA